MAANLVPHSNHTPSNPRSGGPSWAQLYRLSERDWGLVHWKQGAQWRRIVVFERFQLHLGSQNFFTPFSIVILISRMFRPFSLPRFPITNRLVCIRSKNCIFMHFWSVDRYLLRSFSNVFKCLWIRCFIFFMDCIEANNHWNGCIMMCLCKIIMVRLIFL